MASSDDSPTDDFVVREIVKAQGTLLDTWKTISHTDMTDIEKQLFCAENLYKEHNYQFALPGFNSDLSPAPNETYEYDRVPHWAANRFISSIKESSEYPRYDAATWADATRQFVADIKPLIFGAAFVQNVLTWGLENKVGKGFKAAGEDCEELAEEAVQLVLDSLPSFIAMEELDREFEHRLKNWTPNYISQAMDWIGKRDVPAMNRRVRERLSLMSVYLETQGTPLLEAGSSETESDSDSPVTEHAENVLPPELAYTNLPPREDGEPL